MVPNGISVLLESGVKATIGSKGFIPIAILKRPAAVRFLVFE